MKTVAMGGSSIRGTSPFMLQRARLKLREARERRRPSEGGGGPCGCFLGTAVIDRADEMERRAAAVWIMSRMK